MDFNNNFNNTAGLRVRLCRVGRRGLCYQWHNPKVALHWLLHAIAQDQYSPFQWLEGSGGVGKACTELPVPIEGTLHIEAGKAHWAAEGLWRAGRGVERGLTGE